MNFDLIIILGLIIHYFADFIMQTNDEATNKSKNNYYLLSHTTTYSMIWVMIMTFVYILSEHSMYDAFALALCFGMITFVCHTITDFCTSRLSSFFFKKNDYHNGFVVIGADQILHYLQLYYTYKLLTI